MNLVSEFLRDWNKTHFSTPHYDDVINWAINRQNSLIVDWLLEHHYPADSLQELITFLNK